MDHVFENLYYNRTEFAPSKGRVQLLYPRFSVQATMLGSKKGETMIIHTNCNIAYRDGDAGEQSHIGIAIMRICTGQNFIFATHFVELSGSAISVLDTHDFKPITDDVVLKSLTIDTSYTNYDGTEHYDLPKPPLVFFSTKSYGIIEALKNHVEWLGIYASAHSYEISQDMWHINFTYYKLRTMYENNRSKQKLLGDSMNIILSDLMTPDPHGSAFAGSNDMMYDEVDLWDYIGDMTYFETRIFETGVISHTDEISAARMAELLATREHFIKESSDALSSIASPSVHSASIECV
jgi:hypothetical protein